MPGAGIDDVTEMMNKVSEEATADSLFVIHAGSNDVRKTRSEELLDKYRKLIQQYKTVSQDHDLRCASSHRARPLVL